MKRWFAYIVLLLIFAPYLSSAVTKPLRHGQSNDRGYRVFVYAEHFLADTIIVKKEDDKNKIKEVSKSKRQAKPEKLDEDVPKPKSKREQRPAGMERPPEIPRRNNN